MNYTKKEKKIPSTKSRSEIVADNIFRFLKLKNKQQKDLAEQCSFNPSEISKWKKYQTKVSIDDLDNIAKFLEISIEELIYSEEEIKRGIPQLIGKVDPSLIKAQRLVNVTAGAPINRSHMIIIIALVLALILLYICRNIYLYDDFNIIIYILFFIGMFFFKKSFDRKETYVVNYMSDVFFKIENKKNQYYIFDLITSIVCCLYSIFITGYLLIETLDSSDVFMLSFLIPSIIHTFFSCLCLGVKRNYKEEIYHWEFESYNRKYNILIISGINLLIAALLTLSEISFVIIFIIPLTEFILRIINFCLEGKKCSEYKLAIIDEEKNIKYFDVIYNNEFPK